MTSTLRIAAGAALFSLSLPGAAAAQDLFGAAVALHGDQIVVAKAGSGRGPAALHVYRMGAGGWELAQRLVTPGTANAGHGLSPSLAMDGDLVLVASGDPDLAIGAHAFTRATGGAWELTDALRLAEPADAPADVSLGAVMRILQPTRRLVALHGDQSIVAVPPGRGGEADVRVYERLDTGWTEISRLAPADAVERSGFGGTVAAWHDAALVGAPGLDPTGAVYIFARNGEGNAWEERGLLTPDTLAASSGFGSALAVGHGLLVVGAPRAGQVLVYAHSDSGLVERGRLHGDAGTGFGSALAVAADEILVGAPRANGGTGAVFRFARDEAGAWVEAGALAPAGADGRWAFGAALAVSDDHLVVGAPFADVGQGRAAVYTRAADGAWGDPAWLRLDADLVAVTDGEVACAEGMAAQFTCSNVDLSAYLSLDALGASPGEGVTDIWGWTDPDTGREYALVGRTAGVVFVDITEPASPRLKGILASNRAGLRDIKTWADHAFVVGDGAGDHGLVVFDLTRLRTAPDSFTTFEPDARYDGIASAHNLVINTDAGVAIPVGANGGGNTCGGGLHMVDIREPTAPVFAGCFTDDVGLIAPGRTHDAQCVAYRGPDADHQGKQICFAANETALRIVDVTDPAKPAAIAIARYPGAAYVHQGWLTDDQRYFYMNDELDELVGTTERTRTLILDLEDLDDPVLVGQYQGETGATDHNLYVHGDRMYQANYQGGFRIIDISDRLNPVEVGYFDTTPYPGNPAGFYGAWTAWPWFESGTVIVSSMGEGLFILKPRPQTLTP